MNLFSSFAGNYTLSYASKVLFAQGNKVDQQNLIRLLEKKYQGRVILTYKCREAIELGLKMLDMPKNVAVAICSLSCQEVVGAIANANLQIEYIKEKDGLNFDAKELRKVLKKNPRIRVVLVQNTLGFPCPIEKIDRFCRQRGLILIEDLAHCIGGRYENGQEMGKMGDLTVLSFSQNKILDVTAGGALIIKNSKFKIQNSKLMKEPNFRRQLADRINPLGMYVTKNIYPVYIFFQKLVAAAKSMTKVGDGIHTLPSWYCQLALIKFRSLDEELAHRRAIAKIYSKEINRKALYHNLIKNIDLSANFRFPIKVSKKQALIKYLSKHHIFVDDSWFKGSALTLPTHINVSSQKAVEISGLINKWSGF